MKRTPVLQPAEPAEGCDQARTRELHLTHKRTLLTHEIALFTTRRGALHFVQGDFL